MPTSASRSSSASTILALALLATSQLGCGGVETRRDAEKRAPLVEAVEARVGALPIEVTVPGTVRARNQVMIRPEVSGRVIEVLAQSGDAATRGQTLVRIDPVEARERLRQAEADVELAVAAAGAAQARRVELGARVARTRSLAEQALVSIQELETLEAQLAVLDASAAEAAARVKIARATAEERRSAVGKTVVRAPVAGRLGERQVEVGMLVDPADVLFQIGDLDELIVEVNLTEAMLATVAEGQPVAIETRSDQPPVTAAVSRISPFLAEESFTTRGEIDVENRDGRLRPGMFVSVRILVGESDRATLVPVSALWEDPDSGTRGVFVVDDAAGLAEANLDSTESPDDSRTISLRRVEILAEGRGAAGVEGVAEGDWVVILGQHLLAAELRTAAADAESDPRPDVRKESLLQARVRPVSWRKVAALQSLQNEDLLADFLHKQRTIAAALGAEIPESEDAVDRVMREAEGAEPTNAGGS